WYGYIPGLVFLVEAGMIFYATHKAPADTSNLILPFQNAVALKIPVLPDNAVNEVAMARLPQWVQRRFLRHERSHLWYQLAVRHRYKAPERRTLWTALGDGVEEIAVCMMDLLFFVP